MNDPNGKINKALRYVDIILTTVFIAEIVLKCIAYGILLNGPQSYLRDYWNILDSTIVIISVSFKLFLY